MKFFLISSVLLFTFSTFSVYSQYEISGVVRTFDNAKLSNVNILCKAEDNSLVAYSFSDKNGLFVLTPPELGKYNIEFSSLGYKSKVIEVNISTETKQVTNVNAMLEKVPLELNEVIVSANHPITIKKDTIVFDAKAFAKGDEEVIEDLLKNIPGISIDSEGIIKVGNKEVEKVMVEGDDFFEKKYSILTKNMPSQPIEKVELLQDYSNNRLLKGIENSDKIALNLKLKEDAKNIWFGNIDLGYGITSKNTYELNGILLNFTKKYKYYFSSNLNSIGRQSSGNINGAPITSDLFSASIIDGPSEFNNLINLSSLPLNFRKQRTNFNNEEIISANIIFNPSDALKIKSSVIFNGDENNFGSRRIDIVEINETNFTNVEEYDLKKNSRYGYAKVDLLYNISKFKDLEAYIKYDDGLVRDRSDLVFNDLPTKEGLRTDSRVLNPYLKYSIRIKDNDALIITGSYINNQSLQNYSVNQLYFAELINENTDLEGVQQINESNTHHLGFESNYLHKNKRGDLFELKLGNFLRENRLKTQLSLINENNETNELDDFRNDIIYNTNDLYLYSKYFLKFKDLAIISELSFHGLSNKLKKTNSLTENQNAFFVNPQIGLDWSINKKNKLKVSYAYATTNAEILDVYDNFALTGYNTLARGTGTIDQLDSSKGIFSYQLGNYSDRFFANLFVLYVKNHDFYTSNSLVRQDFNQSEKILIQDRQLINITTNVDYFINELRSNLKINIGYNSSNYKNIVNSTNLREVRSNNYNFGLELRSGFSGVFNFHLGTNWTKNNITTTITNSFTNNLSFIDASFVINEKFNLGIQTERYFFGNILNGDDTYYFFDFDVKYNMIPNKLSFKLSGKNLFNVDQFQSTLINDIGTSITEYRLLPRYILFNMKFRF